MGITDKTFGEMIMTVIKDIAPDGTLSYKDFRQEMAWKFKLDRKKSKAVMYELRDKGLIELGTRGLRVV